MKPKEMLFGICTWLMTLAPWIMEGEITREGGYSWSRFGLRRGWIG